MATTIIGKIGLNPCGAYDETATYAKLDVVFYKGSSYVCICDDEESITNVAPTDATKWSLVASGIDLTEKVNYRAGLGIYTGTVLPETGEAGDIFILHE